MVRLKLKERFALSCWLMSGSPLVEFDRGEVDGFLGSLQSRV
ncbi:hypothetical protein PA08_0461 [Cutibacterium modestum P08]|nr:hypothetical protein PA08_0461 [Cutibacterium modestum P08]